MLKPVSKGFAYSILGICLISFLNGCASKRAYLKDLNRSRNTIHLAIKYALKGNVKKLSSNFRTYFSPYHLPGMDLNALTTNKKKRARVMISVHGNRRPYSITIAYIIEEYRFGKYRFDYYDRKRAGKYKEKIEEYLASRPEQKDIIDDFLPY